MSVSTMPTTRTAESTEAPNYWVFYDGEFVRYRDVRIGLMTHAFQYGTACFEGIRAYADRSGTQLYLLQGAAHYDRLRRSGRLLRMTLPYSSDELVELTCEVLRRNEFHEDVHLRPVLFKSSEVVGVRLHDLRHSFAIHGVPFGNYVEIERGLRCMVSSWRRTTDQAIPARGKITGSYVNSAFAKTEALESGFDEAIVLTTDGHVSEASAANIFIVKNGAFVTPPVTDDILEGITRSLIMGLIRDELGMPVIERSIDRTELYSCDEIMFCGTGVQIAPVSEVDRVPIGSGEAGPLVRALQDIYFAAVRGENPKYADWLTPVYR